MHIHGTLVKCSPCVLTLQRYVYKYTPTHTLQTYSVTCIRYVYKYTPAHTLQTYSVTHIAFLIYFVSVSIPNPINLHCQDGVWTQ